MTEGSIDVFLWTRINQRVLVIKKQSSAVFWR
jgi:hypothetical protein